MKRKMCLVLAGLMVAGLAGCGADQKGSSADGNEEMEIVYAHFQGEGDAPYKSIQNAITAFEKDNPGITIKEEYYPSDAYLLQAETWSAAGELPDICMVNGSMASDYADIGTILDLTSYAEEYGITDKIDESYFKEMSADGAIYGIPWEDAHYAFILYNEGIFKEVGVTEFPKTLDELIDVSKKIADAGYIPMAMGDKALWPADSLAFSAFVNNFVGNDWFDSILACDGKAAFTDKEFVDALDQYQRLAKEGVFNDNLSSIDNDQRGALYQNREAAMISAGNWECNSCVEIAPEVAEETQVALWPAPAENAKAHDSVVSSSAWGLALGSNIDEEKIPYAMDFIANYICSEDFGKVLAEEQGMFTPWKVEYDTSKLNIITQREQEVSNADGVTRCLNWDSSLPASVKDVYQRGLQEVLMQIKEPADLADEMQTAYEEYIDMK